MANSTKNTSRRPLKFRPLPASRLPRVIPPRSVVILASVSQATPDWLPDRGRIFRIGYYNRADGLDCIWLVNGDGEYEQTTDRKTLLEHFVILQLSNEFDLYGERRAPLKPLKTKHAPAYSIPQMMAG